MLESEMILEVVQFRSYFYKRFKAQGLGQDHMAEPGLESGL